MKWYHIFILVLIGLLFIGFGNCVACTCMHDNAKDNFIKDKVSGKMELIATGSLHKKSECFGTSYYIGEYKLNTWGDADNKICSDIATTPNGESIILIELPNDKIYKLYNVKLSNTHPWFDSMLYIECVGNK